MKLLFKIIIFNFLYGFTPNNFSVIDINNSETRDYRDTENNLADDTIVDLRDGYNNNSIYVGTSGGISRIDISSTSFSHFVDENLPDGGNPATITYELTNGETMIVVSGVLSYYSSAENANIPYGTGIAWSLDSGENWLYTDQPTDELPECEELGCEDPLDSPNNCECSPGSSGCTWNVPSETCSYVGSYIPFDWYGQTAYLNPITVDEKNVTYDISVDLDKKYIYIASWAGMLRRLKYTDFQPTWELVPLPEDISQTGDEDQLLCGGIGQSYVYNPVDISGNNNHKVFSVHVEEDEIWAGTANGVNKGIIGEDNCIDWIHYSSNNSSLTRDWVIDIVPQDLSNGETRIWLIAREVVSPPAPHGITYTDNGGTDWVSIGNLFNEEDALIYNLYFSDSYAYASTDRGLFICDTEIDMEIWEELEIPNNCFNDTETVYSYIKNNEINFVGTPNGLIYNCDNDGCGNGWCIEDYINLGDDGGTTGGEEECTNDDTTSDSWGNTCTSSYDANPDDCGGAYADDDFDSCLQCCACEGVVTCSEPLPLYVFPNPASSSTSFLFQTDYYDGRVDIFDFSMNIVFENIDCYQSFEDDGNYYLECDYDNIKLSNGVYFCRLSYGKNEAWNKLMIINN